MHTPTAVSYLLLVWLIGNLEIILGERSLPVKRQSMVHWTVDHGWNSDRVLFVRLGGNIEVIFSEVTLTIQSFISIRSI